LAYVFLYIKKRFMKTSHSKEPKKRAPKQTRETVEERQRKPKQTHETLAERVHRHLNDINSKITDDDIRNVRTELEIRSQVPTTPPTNALENGKRRHSGKPKTQNKPGTDKQITPWDISNED
jgi:hypothetical protein